MSQTVIHGFSSEQLGLPYHQWKALVKDVNGRLAPGAKDWLASWQSYDLHASPMEDGRRAIERYAHYQGWHDFHSHLTRLANSSRSAVTL